MFGNILAAALGNFRRNLFHVLISIVGLSLGLTAVILTALYVRDEMSFDAFIPGNQDVYVISSTIKTVGQADVIADTAPARLAKWLKAERPEVREVARLVYEEASVGQGSLKTKEDVAWVDPTFFKILPLPVIDGSLDSALVDPNSVVLTQGTARRLFGSDAVVGRTVLINDRNSMRVTAVLKDLPPETHLTQTIFASGAASYSLLKELDDSPYSLFYNFVGRKRVGQIPEWELRWVRLRTYVSTANIQAADSLRAALPEIAAKHADEMLHSDDVKTSFQLIPLTRLHLNASKGGNLGADDGRGSIGAIYALTLVAFLVLTLSIINYVNLSTARATRRSLEVGVRKALGAGRSQLLAQFLGEAVIYTLVAMVTAIALCEMMLPTLNAFLLRDISFEYWREPLMAGALLLLAVVVGVLAGIYPALVLARFRAGEILQGGKSATAAGGGVRQVLVVFQFAVLVVLVVCVATVWRQTLFAMGQGLQLQKDNVLIVHATPCRGNFADAVLRVPGVTGAACSSRALLGLNNYNPTGGDSEGRIAGRPEVGVSLGLVDYGFFDLYGIKPIAGRDFSRSRPGDDPGLPGEGVTRTGSVILNQTAVRKFGFKSAEEALNKEVMFKDVEATSFTVIGVVPDFTVDLRTSEVRPTAYYMDFGAYPLEQVLSIKLSGQDLRGSVSAIEQVWRRDGRPGAIKHQFLSDYIQRLYMATIREGYLITALCAIALILSCLGLLGMAAFTAESRTKEIGIRKAMGASVGDILKLLLWQFARPVLLANLIGLPIAYWFASQWLEGFSYRVSLGPVTFVAAFVLSALIALATVFSHAISVARAKPVTALRYE